MYTEKTMRSYFFILLLCLSACAGPEVNQDGGDLTRSEVELLSGRLASRVEEEYPLLKHQLVNRYVNTLGQSIVSRNPDMPPLPYEFRVLRSNEIFVFSLPGGIVYVSLGAIRATELEGQLAAALSHELAHQQLNHPLQLWRRKVNGNRGQRNLLDFTGSWGNNFLGQGGAIFLPAGLEEEADRLAPVILYRAKFDPRLYTSYLQILKKAEATNGKSVAMMASLHPPIATRLAWTKDALVKIPPLRDASLSSQTFQQIKSILQQAAKRGTAKPGVE